MAKNVDLISICFIVFFKLCTSLISREIDPINNAVDVRHHSWPNISDYKDQHDNTGEVQKQYSKPFWEKAVVPFYVENEHYDHSQVLKILKALSIFNYKTCLHFSPVMTRPTSNQHVLLIENPKGVRACVFEQRGHSVDKPHILVLGYECLSTPDIDMAIMRALGFPFEHNNPKRDEYIDVRQENLIPSAINLFQKYMHRTWMGSGVNEYDYNSVMHLDERAFSKNGHKTIVFKDPTVVQDRSKGLTKNDLQKIDTVYRPYCRRREHQEKIEICRTQPTPIRVKRDAELLTTNLRVNPNITPPPEISNKPDNLTSSLRELGIEKEVQDIVELVNKASAMALSVARARYCNNSKPALREQPTPAASPSDLLGIIAKVHQYAQSMVTHALANLTEFCEVSQSIDVYQRARASCPFYDQSRCVQTNFKSTKSGPVKYSTQHRPIIKQSTKHRGAYKVQHFVPLQRAREDNETDAVEAESVVTEAMVSKVTEEGKTEKAGETAEPVVLTGVVGSKAAGGARRKRQAKEEVKIEKQEESTTKKNIDEVNHSKKLSLKEKLKENSETKGKLKVVDQKKEIKIEKEKQAKVKADVAGATTKGSLRFGRTVLLTKPPVEYAPDDR